MLLLTVAACSNGGSNGRRVGSAAPTGAAVARALDPLASAPLGRPGCDPASPLFPSRLGGTETRLTPAGIEGWALFFESPPWQPGRELKLVSRVSGSGGFAAVARGSDGVEIRPSWGPIRHGSSNYERPGAEWGAGFTFPTAGCWELRVMREEGAASIWLVVGDASA